MAPTGYIPALYVGPPACKLMDGTDLVPGETVVDIPEGEAHESANWTPVVQRQAKNSSAATRTTTEDDD